MGAKVTAGRWGRQLGRGWGLSCRDPPFLCWALAVVTGRLPRVACPAVAAGKLGRMASPLCSLPLPQDAPPEPPEPAELPAEDTETDELWAALEAAAAKRKLPDSEPTLGAPQSRRRKKKRPGSVSP